MRRMDRRQFLRSLSLLAMAGCSPAAVRPRPTAPSQSKFKLIDDWSPLPPRVISRNLPVPSVIGTSHAPDDRLVKVENLVREAVEKAGGFNQVVRPGDQVLIKPNLVTDLPNGTGFTTDFRVVEAIARMALDCGAKMILFAEGSSTNQGVKSYHRDLTEKCFARGGYADLAEKMGALLVDLNEAGEKDGGRELVRKVEVRHGLQWTSYWISKRFLDADCVISAPVLKNHRYAGATLSLKNYIGIAPGEIYQVPGVRVSKSGLDHSLSGLARHIVDLAMIRPPDYTVIDALVGISSGDRAYPYRPGPKGRMRAILAGRDPVAADSAACMAMNYDPRTIGHLLYASAVGLGISDPDKIGIKGAGIEPFRQDFPIPVAGSWYVPGRYGQRKTS
jgi:uncharacterized protein (DUF362 family)